MNFEGKIPVEIGFGQVLPKLQDSTRQLLVQATVHLELR
jgi:hypothetical protein